MEVSLDNVALFLVRDGWLRSQEFRTLASLDVEYSVMVHEVQRSVRVYFSPLSNQRLVYEEQKFISRERVKMMMACEVHHDLDFGLVTRYLGGEYKGAGRDVYATLAEIGSHVNPDDFHHIKRLLTEV